MSVIVNSGVETLATWGKKLGPDHQIESNVIEILNQSNEIIPDAGWIEGNMEVGHQYSVRTGLPPSYYAAIGQYVPVGISTVYPLIEQSAHLKAYVQVAKDLAELGGMGNVAKYRASEARAQLESFNQQFAQTAFYGLANNPAQFPGFATRFNTTQNNANPALNSQNVLDAGGTGSTNASIWLIDWSPRTVSFFFPRGSKAGIDHLDLGQQTDKSINYGTGAGQFTDSGPGLLEVYREYWSWKHGLAIMDWRYVVRIANIDVPSLLAKTGVDIRDLLIRATHHIPNLRAGRPAIYMNRTVMEMYEIQARDAVQKGGQLRYEVVDGVEIPVFQGIPVRLVDQLLLTEGRVL
jgi:hypothetical protein